MTDSRLRATWHRLIAAVSPPTPYTPTGGPPMTDTRTAEQQNGDVPGVPVPDRIAAVDAELAALDAKTAADPVTGAADLDRWRARDTARRDRAAQLVQRRRDLETFGALLDDHDAPLRAFLAVVAPLRHRYADLAATRNYGARDAAPPEHRTARTDLIRWSEALGALGKALPAGHDDARTYLAGQWAQWFAARDGWARAILGLDGRGLLPVPEIGLDAALPPGIGYGVHLLDDPTARQAAYQVRAPVQVRSFHDWLTSDDPNDTDGSDLRVPGRVIRT